MDSDLYGVRERITQTHTLLNDDDHDHDDDHDDDLHFLLKTNVKTNTDMHFEPVMWFWVA